MLPEQAVAAAFSVSRVSDSGRNIARFEWQFRVMVLCPHSGCACRETGHDTPGIEPLPNQNHALYP